LVYSVNRSRDWASPPKWHPQILDTSGKALSGVRSSVFLRSHQACRVVGKRCSYFASHVVDWIVTWF